MRNVWTLFGVGAFAAVGLATPLGCSSSTSSTACCTVTTEGESLCLCGTEAADGTSCSSSATGSSCTITCTQDGETETVGGTVTASCGATSMITIEGGVDTGCGYSGGPCCTDGTPCSGGCCDPAGQTCVFAGEECSGGNSVCTGSSCAPCGGTGQACCNGDQCTDGCCDTQSTPTTCVGVGSQCGDVGIEQVCLTGGICESCGDDGEPCCPGNTCSDATTVCVTTGASSTCSTCGYSGGPCCTMGTACMGGTTCNGTTCP
jgi:hypothetical protein